MSVRYKNARVEKVPLNICILWNAGTACVSECVLKTLACRGLRVGPSRKLLEGRYIHANQIEEGNSEPRIDKTPQHVISGVCCSLPRFLAKVGLYELSSSWAVFMKPTTPNFLTPYFNSLYQKVPRAHKNKIGTSPPPKKTTSP